MCPSIPDRLVIHQAVTQGVIGSLPTPWGWRSMALFFGTVTVGTPGWLRYAAEVGSQGSTLMGWDIADRVSTAVAQRFYRLVRHL